MQFIGLDQNYCIDAEGNNDTEPADAPDCDGAGDFATLLPNLQGLYFSEAQPGYLAGVLACSISETGVVGAVGGIFSIPPVPQYIGGYQNGCLSVNPDANVQWSTCPKTSRTRSTTRTPADSWPTRFSAEDVTSCSRLPAEWHGRPGGRV